MKSTENKTLKSIGKLALIALIVGGAFSYSAIILPKNAYPPCSDKAACGRR